MTIDLDVLLLAAAGAGLLVAGGALLRPAGGRDAEREGALKSALDDAEAHAEGLVKKNQKLEADLAKAKDEAQMLRTGVERAGYESSAEREQLEARVTEATRDLARVTDELKAEQTLVQQMEASLDEVRGLLRTSMEDLRTTKEALAAAEARPAVSRSMPPRSVEAAVEIDELKRSLATMTEERDAARNKAEAMERLVEGVRVRSRELAKELSELKQKHGA